MESGRVRFLYRRGGNIPHLDGGVGQAAIINGIPGFSATIVYDYVRVFENTSALPPTAGAPLSSVSGTAGQDVVWPAGATGSAPFAYQWRKNETEIAGATGSTLALANIQALDAGVYDVVIMNVAGSITSNGATLSVSVPVAPFNAVVTITFF